MPSKIRDLLKDQIVHIDTHERGCGVPNEWKHSIHLHKYKKNESDVEMQIRVPFGRDLCNDDKISGSQSLYKEVKKVLQDNQIQFVNLIEHIVSMLNRNYYVCELHKLHSAIQNLLDFFDLEYNVKDAKSEKIGSDQGIASKYFRVISNPITKVDYFLYVDFKQRKIIIGENYNPQYSASLLQGFN